MMQTEMLLAGRYRMGRLLGSGGFGSVYLATDERLHRPVAIKVCSTRGLPQHEADEAARLFQSEALTLARLRHPGLTAIWDYFNEDENWYLVMEYVPGETLRTLLKRNAGPIPHAEAISYTRQLCAVLSYLHRQHPPVVFRDLKPANIMITTEGQLKLIDFGIARLFSPGKAADTAQFGTPGYAPPEQYGGQTEPRSDIYSMGVVLHQMLTGHNPSSTPFALPRVGTLNPAIDARLEELVVRATAYYIDDRIDSADEFCTLLDDATTHRASAYTMPASRFTQQTAQTQTMPTTNRTLWAPQPRALPARPASSGFWRGLIMLALLMLLLGSLGTGIYLLRAQIAGLTNDLTSIVAPTPPVATTQPAFTVFSATVDDAENLYIQRGAGDIRKLTNFSSPTRATQPAISPDRSLIAFTKEATVTDANTNTPQTRLQLWVMDVDGGNQRQLLPSFVLARAPAWRPDGKVLAVEVADESQAWRNHNIVTVNVASGEWQQVVSSPYWEGGPAWSPDGSKLVYHARAADVKCMQLFVVNAQGGTPEQFTNLRGKDCTAQSSGDYWPDWSPDGAQIAFGRKISGVEQIVVKSVVTNSEQILNTGVQPAGYPRWSADGSALIFEQGKGDEVALAYTNLESCENSCNVKPIDTTLPGSHLADWQ